MEEMRTQQQGVLSTIREFAVLLTIVFLIRTFGFGLYQVPTGSMETTMLVGERFFADKFTPLFLKLKRGDIIAMNDPVYPYSDNFFTRLFQEYVWGPSNWTKRIIGIPGDHLQGKIENGKPVVYLNGKKLDEPHLNTYPLVREAKESPAILRQKITSNLRRQGIDASRPEVQFYVAQQLLGHSTLRSYDPSKSFDDQPFYRINPDNILRFKDGKPILTQPGQPLKDFREMIKDTVKNVLGGSVGGYNQEEGVTKKWADEFDVKLGNDEYWMMGDNRLGSHDCRGFGPVKRRFIHGKILFRIWSSDSSESWWIWDLIKNPVDFWKRMRWSRFFQWVR